MDLRETREMFCKFSGQARHFQISNENDKCCQYFSAFFAGWQGISWDQFNFANTHNQLAFFPLVSPP
jgi:hypothetical protein